LPEPMGGNIQRAQHGGVRARGAGDNFVDEAAACAGPLGAPPRRPNRMGSSGGRKKVSQGTNGWRFRRQGRSRERRADGAVFWQKTAAGLGAGEGGRSLTDKGANCRLVAGRVW